MSRTPLHREQARFWHAGRMSSADTQGTTAGTDPQDRPHLPVRTRSARFADLDPHTAYLLWQLRSDVFVVEQDCPYLDLDGRDLEPDAVHVWLEAGPADPAGPAHPADPHTPPPLGTLRILQEPDGQTLRIGRVVVARKHRGRGLAARLMQAALEIVGDRPSVLDAQAHLAHWYARSGYTVSGPEFLEDGIPHVPMTRG